MTTDLLADYYRLLSLMERAANLLDEASSAAEIERHQPTDRRHSPYQDCMACGEEYPCQQARIAQWLEDVEARRFGEEHPGPGQQARIAQWLDEPF